MPYVLFLTLLMIYSSGTAASSNAWSWVRTGLGVGSRLWGTDRSVPPRPADWQSYRLPVEDSRYPVGHRKRKVCDRELIEMPFPQHVQRRGTALLIAGFMENAHAWDLNPAQGVSFARWLMYAKGLKVYMLNIRGVGLSCYPSKSNLDDSVIDDVSTALQAVSGREGKDNFIAIGHSMGGIALQASLAGLDRCGDSNCFREDVGLMRQQWVDGLVVLGSNVEFSMRSGEVSLKAAAQFEKLLRLMPSLLVDRVSAQSIQSLGSELDPLLGGSRAGDILSLLKDPLLHFLFWHYFYSAPNVDAQTRNLFKELALDATSRGTIEQYAVAIRQHGMRATSGEKYSDFLKNIHLPVAQVVFEKDSFADWDLTRTDNFDRLGSSLKYYFRYAGEGHQDFMLNSVLHGYQSPVIDWILESAAQNP